MHLRRIARHTPAPNLRFTPVNHRAIMTVLGLPPSAPCLNLAALNSSPRGACWPPPLFPKEGPLSAPAFTPQDRVEYRWSGAGPFVGEARVVEVLPDGRYRVERLDGTPLPKESSIFSEEQLRLKPPEPVGSA